MFPGTKKQQRSLGFMKWHLGHVHLKHFPHPQPPHTALPRPRAHPAAASAVLLLQSLKADITSLEISAPCGPVPPQCRGDQPHTALQAQFLSHHGSYGSETETIHLLERGNVSHPKAR